MMSGGVLLILQHLKEDRRLIVLMVYLALLLDNMLLTMVVPIIPDYLIRMDRDEEQQLRHRQHQDTYERQSATCMPGGSCTGSSNKQPHVNTTALSALTLQSESFFFEPSSENARLGLLLSSKALVQLLLNPLVGLLTARVGYQLPLFAGSLTLLASALLFAVGEGYFSLFLARSLQGIASACIGVTGMCLVAERYPTEPNRSKVMGFVLGSVALGVLLGYPFGGVMYDFWGKPAPFVIIALFIFLNSVLQLHTLDLTPRQEIVSQDTGWRALLSDQLILITGGAIGISTAAMAILEPCLPLWLLSHIKLETWQLGTVFVPDSLGYVLGTNAFGTVAYHLGRARVAAVAMLLVGISSFLATTVLQLVLPHLLLGLGIGTVDSALVPLLAELVDTRHAMNYGSVYALQQMAVSLSYSLGPMIGGEFVRNLGFPWLMRCVGILNILYSIVLLRLEHPVDNPVTMFLGKDLAVDYQTTGSLYQRFESGESD